MQLSNQNQRQFGKMIAIKLTDPHSCREIPERTSGFLLSISHSVVFSIYFFWTTSHRSWDFDLHTFGGSFGGNFYWELAQSLTRGHLYIDSSGFECLDIEGRCHGYFGPTASILRLPFVSIWRDSYVGLVPLFMALAVGLSMFSMLNLLILMLNNAQANVKAFSHFATLNLAALSLGAGSVLLLSTQPRVYDEAILWSVAFTCIAMNLAYRWFQNQSNVTLALLIAAISLGVLSRGTVIPFAAGLSLGIALLALLQRRFDNFFRAALILGVPLILFASYSYANVGSFGSRYDNYWPYINISTFKNVIDSNNGSVLSPRFFPTVMWHYLRPGNLQFRFGWPWASVPANWFNRTVFVFPVDGTQMLIQYNPGLTFTVPSALLASFIALSLSIRSFVKRFTAGNPIIITILLLASGASAMMSMSWFSLTARYTTDLYPFLSLALIVSIVFFLVHFSMNRPVMRVVLSLWTILTLHSMVTLYNLQSNTLLF
jgi:hypothetical protein